MENNGIEAHSFSYPFNSGDENNDVLDVVSKHYKSARTAGEIDNGKPEHQSYNILGQSFHWASKEIKDSPQKMLNMFKDYVNKHQSATNIYDKPILIYHGVDETEGQTSPDLFNAQMKYLYENDFKVVTMNEIYNQS